MTLNQEHYRQFHLKMCSVHQPQHQIQNDQIFFDILKGFMNEYGGGTATGEDFKTVAEEISGIDLYTFFNQWYYGNGHIKASVTYDYNTINNTVTVNINQQEKVFTFPLSIDIYEGTLKTSHNVWVNNKQNSFTFPFRKSPDLINIDAKHVLLAEFTENKTLDNYIFQFNNAPHYLDRRLALEEIVKHQKDNKTALNTVVKAFNDPYYKIRITALDNIDLFQKYNNVKCCQPYFIKI